MWTCPKCKAGVDEGFEVCWACGTSPDGVEDPSFFNEGGDDQVPLPEDLATVATFWNAPEAHMACAALEAEGIESWVMDELTSSTAWGLLNSAGGVKLQVKPADVDRARVVLAGRVDRQEVEPAE